MADANIRAVITAEDRASGVLRGFGQSLTGLAEAAGGLFALDKIVSFGTSFVDAFNKADEATTKLNAVLSSTGDVSGVTAKQATDLAESLSHVTTFSKTTTLSAEDILLTFTNIGKNIFPQTLQATQNLATGLGEDLSTAAETVGRALDSPANASRSLRSANIVLNTSQQATIKTMVAAGQGAQAQGYILDILSTKFGGAAEAIGQTFGGQVKILQNDLEQTKESIGGVISAGMGPLVDSVTKFVSTNQSLITSLAVGALAAAAFGATIIAVVGAVTLAVSILGGPFTAILVGLSALFGGAVFVGAKNFGNQMKESTASVLDGSNKMATQAPPNFGATGKAADDLAKKLGDIQTQMNQTTADFEQSLAKMVQDNEQKVTDLKSQMDDENASFAAAQASKDASYQQSLLDLQRQDYERIGMTQEQATAEKQIQQQKINILNQQYEADAKNALDAHNKKLADTQTQLDAEDTLLQKHAADVASIQGVQLLDEIDTLKQGHDRQMAAFAQQTADAKNNAAQQIGIGDQVVGANANQQAEMVANVKKAANDATNAFKQNFIYPVESAFDQLKGYVSGFMAGADASPLQKLVLHSIGQTMATLVSGGLFKAAGGPVSGGSPYIVGEQGPELFMPNGSGTIIPNHQLGSGGGVSITIQAGYFMGSPTEARQAAKMIVGHINDLAAGKSMTGAQMLGA